MTNPTNEMAAASGVVLMDLIMPNGKRLADCTVRDLEEAAAFLQRVAVALDRAEGVRERESYGHQKRVVSRGAVLSRVRRRLALDGNGIRVCRSQDMKARYGDYYVFDVDRNFLIEGVLDIEDYARELGVLAEHEAMKNDDQSGTL